MRYITIVAIIFLINCSNTVTSTDPIDPIDTVGPTDPVPTYMWLLTLDTWDSRDSNGSRWDSVSLEESLPDVMIYINKKGSDAYDFKSKELFHNLETTRAPRFELDSLMYFVGDTIEIQIIDVDSNSLGVVVNDTMWTFEMVVDSIYLQVEAFGRDWRISVYKTF